MSVGWLHFLADHYFSLTPTHARARDLAARTTASVRAQTYTRTYASAPRRFLPFCLRATTLPFPSKGVRSVSLHINEKICDFPPSSSGGGGGSSSDGCICEKRRSREKETRDFSPAWRVAFSISCATTASLSFARSRTRIRPVFFCARSSAVITTP